MLGSIVAAVGALRLKGLGEMLKKPLPLLGSVEAVVANISWGSMTASMEPLADHRMTPLATDEERLLALLVLPWSTELRPGCGGGASAAVASGLPAV
mmetsp:Transcript_58124/g.138303  ORF Transcript_58124/g.138303 Transcript_58124/m.138303 type:complete len:97 (+) Transcript_58124:363-653(+)